jgi:hypothetical protein
MTDEIRTIKEVDQFIDTLPTDIQNLVVALRGIILNSSPKLVEEFKWSMPNYTYNGLVCYIQTASKHINFGFHKGNGLGNKDYNKLLLGAGKALRYFKVRSIEDIKPEIFTWAIQEAMSLNGDK